MPARFLRNSLFAAVLLALPTLVACGPVEYVNQVTRRASSELAAARSVKADKWAPYHFTLAVEYLHKAREEAGFADFQAAIRFGRRSSAAAQKAHELSILRASDPDRAAKDLPPRDLAKELEDDRVQGEIAPLDTGEPSENNKARKPRGVQ